MLRLQHEQRESSDKQALQQLITLAGAKSRMELLMKQILRGLCKGSSDC